MKISTAVALRISNILRERNMSQYRLEKTIGFGKSVPFEQERNMPLRKRHAEYSQSVAN